MSNVTASTDLTAVAPGGLDPNGAISESAGLAGLDPTSGGLGPKPDGESHTFDAAYVADLRRKADNYRQSLRKLEEAEAKRQAEAKAADELRLAEQQKWQELAQKRQDELTTVKAEAEALRALSTRLGEALNGYLAKEREGVPDHIGALLDKLDVVDQLAYIASSRDAWAATNQRPGGVPPSPKPGEAPALSEEERRQRSFKIRL